MSINRQSSIFLLLTVYNGKRRVTARNKMFMDSDSIRECALGLKLKNCEGFDRIPQRILVDGIDQLLKPLAHLFELIYLQGSIPEQWKVSKTIPIHKKGPKRNIENYRPIANLCSTSKIFEKLILKRILEIQEENNVDITGKSQHGFKKGKGTLTLGIQLQTIIARALDRGEFVLMASLDLDLD